MNITTLATEQKKKDAQLRSACVEEFSTECNPDVVDDESWFRETIAPNPSRFKGRRGRRGRPTLYGDPQDFAENGEKKHWNVLWRADGQKVVDAHMESGRTQKPATIEGFSAYQIRSMSLGFEETDVVKFFSLDLDGGKYSAKRITRALALLFGEKSIVVHSGSGTKGRYRVLGLLRSPLEVYRLKALLTAICTHLGFPPFGGSLEIYPAFQHSRMPFGMGGCQMFNPWTLKPIGRQNQAACIRAFRAVDPIDLENVVAELGIEMSGIDTGFQHSEHGFNPYTRRERERPTPRHVRRKIALGIEGPGERQSFTWTFVFDAICSGKFMTQAIELLKAYVESGKMDASRDIAKHGRAWFLKQIPRTVRRIYAKARPIGMPDPIPLSERELALVDELVASIPCTRYMSPRRAKKMLLTVLPQFKANLAAGLPLVRMHSDIWQAAGGTHFAKMRSLLGIFVARTKYKSLALVRSLRHLGAKDCEAHAISWSTSFPFDRVLPTPTYDIARSIDLPLSSPMTIVTTPLLLSSNSRFTPLAPPASQRPTRTLRLYVHHKGIPEVSKGSDRSLPTLVTEERPVEPITSDNRNPIDSPNVRSRRQKRLVKRPTTPSPAESTFPSRKRQEWQLLQRWSAPCTEETGLDEWLDETKATLKEYDREKAKAKSDQRKILREQGMQIPLSKLVSERFHELRKIFGLESWR